MFLRPKESLRLSIYSLKRCIGFSNNRDFHLTRCTYLRKISSSRRRTSDVQDYESSSSLAGEFSIRVEPEKVNDNFFGIESNEGVIEIDSKPSLDNNARRQLFKNVEQEKFITTTFGTVRYDSENKPKFHGQLEKTKVLVSSNIEKDKIRDLGQTLQCKSSVENNVLSVMEKSSNTIGNSSYVDELYFPEAYTEKENTDISRLENSPTSTKDKKVNFIEEFYFNDKTATGPVFKNDDIISENINSTDKSHSLPIHEKSTESIANHKLSSFQAMPKLESLPSSSIEDKSNLIEESYFSDKMANESILKNVGTTSKNIGNIDENYPFHVHEKSIECDPVDKQSSIFDDYYVNSISDGNYKNIEKNVNSVPIIRDKKLNLENSIISPSNEMNKVFDKNLSVNEKVEEINEKDIGEQLTLQWNNPSLEDLESYNKFLPDVAHLPKKKNDFLFQSKFLKENELMNRKSSKLKKLPFQRNLEETDEAEKSLIKKEVVKNPQETVSIKVKKESNVKYSNTGEQSETAYDFVKNLRSTKKKLDPELIKGKFIQKNEQYDSKGFRILKNQVPDLKYYTRDEILDLLVKNVLYSDDDLIVLNKPYNLVMHESKTVQDPCLSQYLDDLAAELDKKTYKPKLITVHRLDKETSGCLLLARNEISAQRLLSFFSQRKIIKTYWIVTIKVPDPLEGVIDIPISEGSVNGRARMVLHPNLPKDVPYQNHSKSGKRAVTHYKVIAESGNAALVEAKPETGIKHQIRVHFGFGLSCPILGDHKYSHLDKLAPQKLQADLLQRLHVRQSKVRHIPMHIYARSIFIPQYRDGRNLFVMAPMPIHMSKNLQRLKFKKK